MKKAILIDGNNLMFRSYYATAYTGSIMKNSKGFPTNALYGFVNMINKIVNEESPIYMAVAFDIGKNFRHDMYKEYKDGRIETPKDLSVQFPIAKQILTHMGIKYVEVPNYEADDIIGTFARLADEDGNFDATIISSDRDLLQLISHDVDMKLLKSKDYIRLNINNFKDEYGIEPIQIIDMKALEGDKSDNIPGVKGIGEKGALKLIQEYGTIENLYEHLDELKGATLEKLKNDKENAFFSKKLATIYREVPINLTFEDIIIKDRNDDALNELFSELEFYSFLKKDEKKVSKEVVIKPLENMNLDNFAFYIEIDDTNYHKGSIYGIGIYDGENSYYIEGSDVLKYKSIFKNNSYTYDAKKAFVSLKKLGIDLENCNTDLFIAGYLLNQNIKDDIAFIANTHGYDIPFYEFMFGKKKTLSDEEVKNAICLKAKFIYELKDKYDSLMKEDGVYDLYSEIEIPLVKVLGSMEYEGIKVDSTVLDNMKEEIKIKMDNLSRQIYNYAGEEFNIMSPKQLATILFEKLALPTKQKKRGVMGYRTNHDTLIKMVDAHPIISIILEYRNYHKIYSNYLESLKGFILEDGKVHTIFKQALTRTGRLSSVEPNLQNIPIRSEEGKRIRKAFVPVNDLILSSDYSQIELRVLAHISNSEKLIEAFKNNEDIHTKVASDIYGVEKERVTKDMRRTAKAVIFGIVYGISGFGLGENLDVSYIEAKKFIDKYLDLYPGVKTYMDNIILETKSKGYVRTLMNRKRVIDELSNPNYMVRQQGERIALNTPIQGSSADIIKLAMINVYNELIKRNMKSKLIVQVHDELVFDVVNEEKDELIKVVTDIMENAYKLVVPLKVEIEYGKNWYDAK